MPNSRVVEETIVRGGHVLRQQRPPYKSWHRLLRDREFEEIVLEPGRFLSNREINDKWNHEYHPDSTNFETIEKSTLFWYPPGVYKEYPHVLYGGEQREIAGVFLKSVIPQRIQDEALAGLEKMRGDGPSRKETKTAVERQRGNMAPKELTIGMIRPL